MTLPLTPDMLERAYEFLKVTPPFIRWKLPDADDVKFGITRENQTMGKWVFENGQHCILISNRFIGHTHTLFAVVAHEMVHVHRNANGHDRIFKRHALQVCKYHGFDPRSF